MPAVSPQLHFRQGLLLTLSPGPLLLLGQSGDARLTAALLGASASLALAIGTLLLSRRPLGGRLLASAGVLAAALLALLTFLPAPLGLLLLCLAGGGLLSWIWDWTAQDEQEAGAARSLADAARVQGGFWGAAALSLAGVLSELTSPWSQLAVLLAPLLALALAALWSLRWRNSWSRVLLLLAALLLTLGAPQLLQSPYAVLLALPLLALLALSARRQQLGLAGAGAESLRWSEVLYANPAQALVLTFLLLVASGSLLLILPLASASAPVSTIDALFTATSATCVTGLIVLDTPTAWSGFGQLVLLALIQVGGLGIMIFSVASLSLVGRRLSLRQEQAASELLGTEDRRDLQKAVRAVLTVTFGAEAAGALVLAALFAAQGDGLGLALWRGLFTSISAFCNAGFALQTESLIPYQHSPLILLAIGLLIVVGGIGPSVIYQLPRLLRRRGGGLHARLVLWTTAFLLLLGFLFILAAEGRGTLAGMSLGDRLANAAFQSITLRTAGFNSIELTQVSPPTLTMMMGLMFVGGSPASTAGGVKTTTLAVLALMIWAALTRRQQIQAHGFRVPQRTVYKATAVSTLGVLAVLVILVVLQLTQAMPPGMALFEVISALGTVGLSVGGTARLDALGKLWISAAMFTGRVGPLTLFMLMASRVVPERAVLPEDEVAVG